MRRACVSEIAAGCFLPHLDVGLALGADDRLMSQMDTIGARGIFISLCCVAGSLIGARLLEPIMNRHVGRYAVSRTAKDEGAAQ